MALHIIPPTDFVPDDGSFERLYPIEDLHEPEQILYDCQIQRNSWIQDTIIAIFTEWFKSFFEPNYFKFIRVKTQSTINDFKSFMRQIYKKDKPFLVIDPHPGEIIEDFIFAQNMMNRYNMIDPKNDNIGAKLLYSLEVMQDENFQLVYRRNRFKFDIDTMIMENTMNRQINTYNAMIMNIRHNSKFMLTRMVPFLLPSRHILNIANIVKMDPKSEEFLSYLNTISKYPIIRRQLPNDQLCFFMEQELHIQVEVPSYPSKDTPEMSDAIEWGARIVDNFVFIVDLPTEFLFLTRPCCEPMIDTGIPEDPEGIYMISPIFTDLDWPKEINGYTLTNRIDIMLKENDDPSLSIMNVIGEFDDVIHTVIGEHIERNEPISDLVMVKVYPNGSYQEIASELSQTGVLTLYKPEIEKLYTANIYINFRNVNMIRSGMAKKYIGTIEQY